MSIRLRLIAAFFLCLLLATASICAIGFFSTRRAAFESFRELAGSELDRVQEHITTFMEPGILCVRYMAGLEEVRSSRGRLTSYLKTTRTTVLRYAEHPPHEKLVYDEFQCRHAKSFKISQIFYLRCDIITLYSDFIHYIIYYITI
jgi:hypothetical protein